MEGRCLCREMVQIWIQTEDRQLEAQLEHLLHRWAQAVCVQCALSPWVKRDRDEVRGILFLDGDGGPVEEAARLTAQGGLAVIYISRDPNGVLTMYECHFTSFLPSPVTEEGLNGVMGSCFAYWRQGLRWLEVPFRRDWTRVPLCQLRCVEAAGRESILHCVSGQLRCSLSLGKLAQELPMPPFFQCQRSFIIHLGAVAQVCDGAAMLTEDGQRIPVSRRQMLPLQAALKEQGLFGRC